MVAPRAATLLALLGRGLVDDDLHNYASLVSRLEGGRDRYRGKVVGLDKDRLLGAGDLSYDKIGAIAAWVSIRAGAA